MFFAPNIPPAFRKWRRLLAAGVAMTAAAWVLFILGRGLLESRDRSVGSLADLFGRLLMFLILGGIPLIGIAVVGWAISLAKTRGSRLPCPTCLYDLSGVTDGNVCPECGAPNSHEEIRQMWYKAGIHI